MTVKNVTVENVYFRGIQYADGNDYGTGTIDFENDTVTNVQADPSSVAIFNFGGSGIIQGNHVSYANDAISANWSAGTQFLDNVVTNSGSGIHSDNNGGLGGVADSIQGNNISLGTAGGSAYGIFVFDPFDSVSVQNNTISGVDVGLAAFGGAGGSAAFSGNNVSVNAGGTGALITTDMADWGQANVRLLSAGTRLPAATSASRSSRIPAPPPPPRSAATRSPTIPSRRLPPAAAFDTAAILAANTFDRAVTVSDLGTLLLSIWGDIQSAVNAASSGDTVNVAAGTYVTPSQVVIDQNVSIVGAGIGQTIINPGFDTGDPSSGDGRGWFLIGSGYTVNLSGMTLDGSGHSVVIGVLDHGSGSVQDVAFSNIADFESGRLCRPRHRRIWQWQRRYHQQHLLEHRPHRRV